MSYAYKAKQQARAELCDTEGNKSEFINIIHYSCESTSDEFSGKSPRIASIAVRNLQSGQTKSFSLSSLIEQKKLTDEQVEDEFDNLERKMLISFFTFVREHKTHYWLHWNMRDVKFGFQHLERRLLALGEKIEESIPDEKKIDLSRNLLTIYGNNYIEHPRFEKLCAKNKLLHTDFKEGRVEAELFSAKKFIVLERSTHAKVKLLEDILYLVRLDKLMTNSSWSEIHGSWLRAIAHWTKLKPIAAIILFGLSVYNKLFG